VIRIFLKRKSSPIANSSIPVAFWALAVLVLGGCTPQEIVFRSNELHVASLSVDSEDKEIKELAELAQSQVNAMFGTPDLPKWPEGIDMAVDFEKVKRSAGPVGRNKTKVESGLYRKHCVQCHGTTGDGMGPTSALLAPYPRDFRRGSFKFKSTPIGKKPTHADLVRTLVNGLPGTAMPAFGTLNRSQEYSEDVDALAHYVRFLSIRGEVERRLIVALINAEDVADLGIQIATNVAGSWSSAEAAVAVVPNLDEGMVLGDEHMEAVARGKEIFMSELTACSKCHGKAGDGKGASQDFDDWTKDWTIRAGIDPTKKSEWKSMKRFGALKPVIDHSRNLTLGAFRGGSSRDDIYRRMVLGIEGSPMPAVARKENDNPGVTEQGIQDLVEYVLSLSEASNGN